MLLKYRSIRSRFLTEAAKIEKVDRNTVYFNGSKLTFSNEWIHDQEPEKGEYLTRSVDAPDKYSVVAAEFIESNYVCVEESPAMPKNKENIIAELALRIRQDAAELTMTDCSSTLIIQLLHTVEALEHHDKGCYPRAY